MAGLTLAQAEAQLALYVTAEQKILEGQSYSIGGRELTRADLKSVQSGIASYQKMVEQLSGTTATIRKIKVYGATPA